MSGLGSGRWGSESPEWVPGRPWRWLVQSLIALAAAPGIFLPILLAFGARQLPSPDIGLPLPLAVLAVIALSALVLLRQYVPMNRRIGLTSARFVWDDGLTRRSVRWERLGRESPERLAPLGGRAAWGGWRIVLTPDQAIAVRRYLSRRSPGGSQANPPLASEAVLRTQ